MPSPRSGKSAVDFGKNACPCSRLACEYASKRIEAAAVKIFILVMTFAFSGCSSSPGLSGAPSQPGAGGYADDDAHNHDGSHPPGPADCGSNYMLPGDVARLGSHSFMILGKEDASHIIAEHRSGTPPHNYQYLLRVRLDPEEMAAYENILKDSKTLPAFTTIYFDAQGVQKDRTFFCLQDLPKIFGPLQKKGDEFEHLFPIRASLQKNADHEGAFDIRPSVVFGQSVSLERADVELIVYRYLPAYLAQDNLRQAIQKNPKTMAGLFGHAPLYATEAPEQASKHVSFIATDGAIGTGRDECPHDYYSPKFPVQKTIHNFLLMMETGPNSVLAVNYADQAPHNFQTVLVFKLSDKEMKIYRRARDGAKSPPLLQTRVKDAESSKNYFFCMADLRQQLRSGHFSVRGTVYKDSELNNYKLGTPVGVIDLEAGDVEVKVNRVLASLMNVKALLP